MMDNPRPYATRARGAAPPRFDVLGERSGTILFRDGNRRAELPWERTGPDGLDLLIHGDECRWTAPESRPMRREEIVALARELSDAGPGCVDVLFRPRW